MSKVYGKKTCYWCNGRLPFSKINNQTEGVKVKEGTFDYKYFCSVKCQRAYVNSNGGSDEQSGNKSKGAATRAASTISNAISKEREKKIREKEIEASMTPEQLKAKAEIEGSNKQKVDESNARFLDKLKKIFLYKKNKAAKILHSELQDKETRVRLLIKKEDFEEAADLILEIKHDSNLFIPNSNTSYKDHWNAVRIELLDMI